MLNPLDIQVRRLIVHVLDNQTAPLQPILSDSECDLTPEIGGFFAQHIKDSLEDDHAKVAKFSRADGAARQVCEGIFQNNQRFIRNSKRLAELLFTSMRQSRAISPGDLVVCLYEASNLQGQFLAILKMDLSEAFTHRIRRQGGRTRVQITAQENILPNPKQRLQKCAFVRPPCRDYDMVILDNQIARLADTAGVANFFCKTFLDCELWLTDREKTRLFRSLTTKWIQAHYPELEPSQADVIQSAARQAILSESVNVREFARVTIPSPELRADYENFLREHRLTDAVFTPDRQYAEQATRKVKYKADGGIIVSGEADQFSDIVNVSYDRDAQNRFTVTIKTTQWVEQAR